MRYLLFYLKGMMMGAADIVPGVSGGTIALITGVYQELLESINAFSWQNLSSFKKDGIKGVWKRLKGPFLLSLFGGILSSILLLSRILEWLLIHEPIGLWSFFFGLLIASILFLVKTELHYNALSFLYLFFGAIASYLLTQLTGVSSNTPLWYLFFAGFVGISAMILPGLSGAYILFVLGVYQTVLTDVRMAQEVLIQFDKEVFIKISSELGVFILGILVGIKIFAKFLSRLLKHYPQRTIAVLIGLMLGALNKVWPWQNSIPKINEDSPQLMVAVLPKHFNGGDPEIVKALLLMAVGFSLLFLLEKKNHLVKT